VRGSKQNAGNLLSVRLDCTRGLIDRRLRTRRRQGNGMFCPQPIPRYFYLALHPFFLFFTIPSSLFKKKTDHVISSTTSHGNVRVEENPVHTVRASIHEPKEFCLYDEP
jgi:hypothetical protein